MAEPFCIPASNERDFLLFLIPARIWCVSVLDFSHSNRCVIDSIFLWFKCAFSLMANAGEGCLHFNLFIQKVNFSLIVETSIPFS